MFKGGKIKISFEIQALLKWFSKWKLITYNMDALTQEFKNHLQQTGTKKLMMLIMKCKVLKHFNHVLNHTLLLNLLIKQG